MSIAEVLISRTLGVCGEVAERLKAAVCQVARDQRTGLKFTISGQFFSGSLVGGRCRVKVLGPSLGTLAGTLEPMPMCA
jgi:hypothetical protein